MAVIVLGSNCIHFPNKKEMGVGNIIMQFCNSTEQVDRMCTTKPFE